jgi:hypothetical protein
LKGLIFQLRKTAAVPLVKGLSVSIKLEARWDLEKIKIFYRCLGYTTEEGFVKLFKQKN